MRGWGAHFWAVKTLVESYHRIDPESPVRLAKKTSNLFRPRAGSAQAGLDVAALNDLIVIDAVPKDGGEQTADVQGMCTYEDLVDATLPYGLIPYVVPQLRTITLGGAVTGLGIEATSFRNGMPHESVLELDILTGAGEIVTATPDNEHADLFAAFPNSYGSLGYATRLKIKLEPVPAFVTLRHLRFGDVPDAVRVIDQIVDKRSWEGMTVDGLDGVAFSPDEVYLTLATFTDEPQPTSDYTGQQIYYRSIQERSFDTLTMYDYLWRWDTDWFWCSRAFGAQNRWVRRIWPRRWRRSDVYYRLVGLDAKLGIGAKLDRLKKVPGRERVVQDVEVPLDALSEFLEWFDEHVGMRPVWLCPLQAHRSWPLYPLAVGKTYVNIGFWGTVEVPADSPAGSVNRQIEAKVSALNGHKSLYSEVFYDRKTFDQMYGGESLAVVRKRYDPDGRLTDLYDKAVRNK